MFPTDLSETLGGGEDGGNRAAATNTMATVGYYLSIRVTGKRNLIARAPLIIMADGNLGFLKVKRKGRRYLSVENRTLQGHPGRFSLCSLFRLATP